MSLKIEQGIKTSRKMQSLAERLMNSDSEDARLNAWIAHQMTPAIIVLELQGNSSIVAQLEQLPATSNGRKNAVEEIDYIKAQLLIESYNGTLDDAKRTTISKHAQEVVFLAATRKSNKQIGNRLAISWHTAKNNLYGALHKYRKNI